MTKPNVILLTIDTLRADLLGQTPSLTPNLDRLAERGVYFQQAITGGSWTQAAFPVLLTSTHASMYGGCLGPLAAERPTPVSAFTEAGYRTAAFSTSPLLSRTYGYDRGFHQFVDLDPGESNPWLAGVKGGQFLLRQPLSHALLRLIGQQSRPARLYASATELNLRMRRWLDGVDGPFFMWGHYMDVHWPYHLDEQLTGAQALAQVWRDVSHLHEVNFGNGVMTPAQQDYYVALYQSAVRYTDREVGWLLDYVENSPHADNTVFVIASDHGEEFMERRHWGHVEINLYDEIIKVPLILALPGLASGKQIKRQVSLIDVMPTLLSLCQIPGPAGMLGQNLAPLWGGEGGGYAAEFAVSERWRDDSHIVAIRTERHKLIWDQAQPHRAQLFDLRADPGELEDVSDGHPDVVGALRRHLDVVLQRMEESAPDDTRSEPELDDELVNRLRGLGYVE